MTTHTAKNHLVLLHLSDIHFEEPRCMDPSIDEDHPVRKALINNLKDLVKTTGPVDAILISGDIAHKGHPNEYIMAKKWLSEVATAVGCLESQVFPVPGNHDVTRSAAKERLVAGLRKTILDNNEIPTRNRELLKTYQNEIDRKVLMQPMESYNVFAATYGCDLPKNKPFWQHGLQLAPGWSLVMHGLTSTLFSGPDDDKKNISLFLGSMQHAFSPDEGTIRLAMMHHPPDWLIDQDEVDDSLKNRCALHLLGHKHRSRHTPTKDYIRLAAGAVNPARGSGEWEPGYNLIRLEIVEKNGQAQLKVDTHVQIWQGSPDQFVPKKTRDKQEVFTDYIELHNCPSSVISNQILADQPELPVHKIEVPMEDLSHRDMVMKFWSLSLADRWIVTSSLGLLKPEEQKITEPDRYRLAFDRARTENKTEQLYENIMSKLPRQE